MRVRVLENPKRPGKGLAITFPYSKADVDNIHNILGLSWDKNEKQWHSEGPEVLLDMRRFGIEVEWMSSEAKQIAERFRQQLWDVMDIRTEDSDEEFAYQRSGAAILAAMPNSILGDDMGLGKSKQSLDAVSHIHARNILVVCPKTLSYNWKNEVEKWHPEYTAGVVPDQKRTTRKYLGRETFWLDRPNVVIVNYEKLNLVDWPYNIEWDVVILDEATRLKNSSTAVYKNVKRTLRKTKCTWALTGTPLEIKLVELYNILGLLRPSVLGGFYGFREQHLITDWGGSVVGAKNIELLRDRIGPFMLRRTKKEVLKQLPPKIVNNVFIKMSEPEQNAYQMMTAEFNNWLSEHGVSGRGNPLTEMLRMRQFTCTPWLFTNELGKGSKFEALQELINEWQGKVVVFCFFEEVCRHLQEWLGCHPDAIISGNVPSELRIPRINAFNNDELGKVLISTDAGNQGLNITGADMIIHYDQLWNPQKMHQREDRLHRIGQRNNVLVQNLLCLDTIDYGMYELNREREELFEEVIEGAEEAILRKLDAPRLKRLVEGKLNAVSVG